MKQTKLLNFFTIFLFLIIGISAVSLENLSLNGTIPYLENNLVCNFDLNNTATTSAITWYKNGESELALFYPFEGNSTNALKDFSGNNKTLTNPENITWSENLGMNSTGVFIPVTANNLETLYVDNLSHLSELEEFSISFWVRPSSFNGAKRVFNLYPDISLYTSNPNWFIMSMFGSTISPGVGWSANTWALMTITYDGETIRWYRNTGLISSTANANKTISSNSELYLYNVDTLSRTFNGRVDDFKIHKSALSTTEITNLFNTNKNLKLADDIGSNDIWQCSITPFNSTEQGITYISNSLQLITPPIINNYYTNANISNLKSNADIITFTAQGTDYSTDLIQMKVCRNSDSTWNFCDVIAENLTGTYWNTTHNNSITSYHISTETQRNNTAYLIVYDGVSEVKNSLNYYINVLPAIENLTYKDLSGDDTFYFKEILDYIRVDIGEDADNITSFDLIPSLTLIDADNNIIIDNINMTFLSGNTWEYTNNILLDSLGTWNITIKVTDSDNATAILYEPLEVIKTQINTLGRIFGYDTQTFPTYEEVFNLTDHYGFYGIGVRINNDIIENNWSQVLTLIEQAKNDTSGIVLILDDDLSNVSRTITNIQNNYADLYAPNILNGVLMLVIHPIDVSNTSENTEKINNISKEIFIATKNYLGIYIKEYYSDEINNNYINPDPCVGITAISREDFINYETNFLRTTQSRSRMYYNLTDEFKGYARDWQINILSKLRSPINTSTLYSGNIAELENNDLIVTNNQSTEQTFEITSKLGTQGLDVYDLASQTILDLDTNRTFNITIPAYSGSIVYFTNLDSIVVKENDKLILYDELLNNYPASINLGGASESAFLFLSGSTNPEDGRIFLTDPSYKEADFYTWYGTNGFESKNLDNYEILIVGDRTNHAWVEDLSNKTKLFGYFSTADYGNNNNPIGCTPYIDCNSWNRTYWLDSKKLEIDAWADIGENVQIFLDGLDLGAVNDVDGGFLDGLLNLSDYTRKTRNRQLILNTYTAYQDYANLGDYTMRESVCGRWDNTPNAPIYSYEDIELEKSRAEFHRVHNIPVLGQVFGNITDYEKAYYCYMQTKVLYGDLGLVSFNQPTFHNTNTANKYMWNWMKYPDLGMQLEDKYTENGEILTRRFEKGIVSVNTTSKQVHFENNLKVQNMSLCTYYYDNDDSATSEGWMHYIINDNTSRNFRVYDDDLSAFVKTWKCVDIPSEYYEPSGFYKLEFYYIDADYNFNGNGGLYMYYGANSSQDQLSSWDNQLNDHPVNNENNYWSFNKGVNWAMEFSINASTNSPIDDITSQITRTETGTEVKTISFSSPSNWYNLPLYDKLVYFNKTFITNVTAENQEINLNYDINCNTATPEYNSTTINSRTWQGCYYNNSIEGYDLKIILPMSQSEEYQINANLLPIITNQTITLTNLSGGKQKLQLTYIPQDPDNNSITECKIQVDTQIFTGFVYNGICHGSVLIDLNTTTQIITPIATDEYEGSSSGTSYNSLTAVFNNLSWDNSISNQDIQYFWNNWNITSDLGQNFTNIEWSIDNSSPITIITIENGTNNERYQLSYDLISLTDYKLLENVNKTYYINNPELIFRNLTISNTLNVTLPTFTIQYEPQKLSGTTTEVEYFNGTDWNNISSSISNNKILFEIQELGLAENRTYNLTHSSLVLYSSATGQSSFMIDNLRTYFWNRVGGLRYDFDFVELLNENNTIIHQIPYSQLTNYNNRLSSTNSLTTNESLIMNYSISESNQNQLVTLNFTPLSSSDYYNFDLNYTISTATTYNSNKAIPICNIRINPDRLANLNQNSLNKIFSITNYESFNYDANIQLEYVSGSRELFNLLSLSQRELNLNNLYSQNLELKLSENYLVEGKLTANIILSSSKCKEIILPINVNIGSVQDKNIIEQVIDFAKINLLGSGQEQINLSETSTNGGLYNKIKTDTTPVVLTSILIALSYIILLLALNNYIGRFSNDPKTNYLLNLIVWATLTGLTILMVIGLHKFIST